MDLNTKFDLEVEKKLLPIIYNESIGSKIRNLRLIKNLTIKELARNINISDTTLMHLEQDKINKPYYYTKLICDFFRVDYRHYLNYDDMKENTIYEKLLKIRALSGSKSWKQVGLILNFSEGFVCDLLNRYTPNRNQINRIDLLLKKLK